MRQAGIRFVDNMNANRSSNISILPIKDEYYDSADYLLGTLYLFIERYTELVVSPIIGSVGLVGSVLSGVIMVKDGLHKSSNILLLGLAVADFLLLLHTVNVPRLMTYATPFNGFWIMNLDLIHVCYTLTVLMHFVSVLTLGMSTSLTVFITLERVVAVYLPLRFPRVVTPKRATFVVILSFLMAIPNAVVTQFKYGLITVYLERFGRWVGTPNLPQGWIGSGMEFFGRIMSSYIAPIVPTTIISIGCALIGVKVTTTMRRRQKLTSSSRNRSSSARTRTLFMTSFIFFVTHLCSLFAFVPQLQPSGNVYTAKYYTSRLFIFVTNLLVLFNSSCNVFIYTIFNPKFRKLLKQQLYCAANVRNKK